MASPADWQKDPVRMAAAVKKRARTRRRNLRLNRTRAENVVHRAIRHEQKATTPSFNALIKQLKAKRDALTTTITTLQELRRASS